MTPNGGLVDNNIKISGKAYGMGLTVAYHQFKSESGGIDFGSEIDASVSKTLTPNLSGLIKFAHFNGTGDITTPGNQFAYSQDVTKLMVQADYKF